MAKRDITVVDQETAQLDVQSPKEEYKYRLVKNHNPYEKIKLGQDETFVFPGRLFKTNDEELAKKLLKVADIYGIVEQ